MFGRIFGRGKDDQDQAVCADCGRTLLAGEWTQTVVGDDGEEDLICSLCGQAHARGGGDALTGGAVPANSGRVRETRSEAPPAEPAPVAAGQAPHDPHAESDAFWQALKDKDTEIERLQAQLARAEAERQELAGRFARLGTAGASAAAEPPSALTGDSSEPGERTWGETPAEFAAEMAALRESEAAASAAPEALAAPDAETRPAAGPETAEEPLPAAEAQAAEALETAAPIPADEAGAPDAPVDESIAPLPVEAAAEAESASAETVSAPEPQADAQAPPAIVFEDTQPIPAIGDQPPADDEDASTGEIAASAAVAADGGGMPGAPAAAAPADAPSAGPAVDAEATGASLTLLQRGVDLLNVSRVPRKISETNEQLGLPHVHVGFDDQTVAVTFLWTMGWYRFHVDIDSGAVAMDDRGYEERVDLQPNAGVRADGTVQLAPAQISRAAAQRVQTAPEPATDSEASSQPREEPAAGQEAVPATPEPPSVAAQKPPEILSKSLLGQRSDDETASWEQTKARDFDWDR